MNLIDQLHRVKPKRKNSEGAWEEIPGAPEELRGMLQPSPESRRAIFACIPIVEGITEIEILKRISNYIRDLNELTRNETTTAIKGKGKI